MSKSEAAPTVESQLPGLSLSRFKAAVDAIAGLTGSPGFLLFLSHPHRVRFVADDKVYAEKLAQECACKLSDDDVRTAEIEVRSYLQLCVAVPSTEARLRTLLRFVYDDERENLSDADKARFDELLRSKLEYVDSKSFLKNLRRRFNRLGTSTIPCLQDMDCEVISERQDRMDDERITQPFLRLRLRYTESQSELLPFSMPPWGNVAPMQTKSFELECDESDIDLLIRRLSEAKNLLLKAIEPRAKSDSED